MFQEVVNWVVDFVSINLRHSIVATLLPELCFLTSDFDPTHTFASAIAGGIEGAIGLVLNTLSIFVILKSDKLRKNVLAPLICALAISDIIFCLSLTLLLPQFYNNQPYPEGSIKCILSPLSYR